MSPCPPPTITCPSCYTQQTRRKPGGRCPNCNLKVNVYNGVWYPASIGAPTEALIKLFEKLVSKQMSAGRPKPVVFQLPRKGTAWSREQGIAQRMLNDADNNFELAQEALQILFTDTRFSFKTRSSLMFITTDWPLAVAVARSNIEQRKQAEQKNSTILDKILTKEDIFK